MTESLDPSGDQWEIRQLVERYAQAVDQGDSAAVAALFTEDGDFVLWMDPTQPDPTGDYRGRDAIAKAVSAIKRYRATHHTIATSLADVDGDRATGETRCVAHHIHGEGDDVLDRVLYIRYDEQFARVDGRWRFARREFHVQWVATQSVELI